MNAKVFKAGNSLVIAIPMVARELAPELKPGVIAKVLVERKGKKIILSYEFEVKYAK